MIFRLLILAVLLFAGWRLASGGIATAQTTLATTFAWMYEDY